MFIRLAAMWLCLWFAPVAFSADATTPAEHTINIERAPAGAPEPAPAGTLAGEQVRTEIRYRDGVVTLTADVQEKVGAVYRARGNVRITYKDIVISGELAEYNEDSSEGSITGGARFAEGGQWLTASRAEFNFTTETGAFYDATGYSNREFLISGRTIRKTGPDTFRIEDAFATACLEKIPKWSFSSARAELRLNHTARMRNVIFRVHRLPVFYLPWLALPAGKKERGSGFIPFHTGTSTSKGRTFSEGYYQTLGQSSDLLVYGDYFSLRGLAIGGLFRTRPNADTSLELRLYGIDDRRDQGGMQIAAKGETRLNSDWRAVVDANIYSNFAFRQAFAEDLESATVPTERAMGFLTRNHGSLSVNIAFARDVVLFPGTPLITKKTPALEVNTLSMPLGRSPFTLDLRAALEGVSRSDSLINTGSLVQRMDIFSRLSLRLPALGGFAFTPSVGVRETYYGAQLAPAAPDGVIHEGMHRQYFDFRVDVRTPTLQRDFQDTPLGALRHVVEPRFSWRRIQGIDDMDRIIRFDEEDAIANTNEISYGLINRFFHGEASARREFMSLELEQKYYFDPTFGDAFTLGQPNSFYPLDSLTGFYQTGLVRNFSPLSATFRLSPQTGVHNDLRADFDVKRARWRNVSLATLWEQGDFYLSGTYFVLRPDEPGLLTGNHVQGQIGYGNAARGLTASFAASYNLSSGQWLNSNTRLSYAWNCCSVGAEVNQYDLGLRTESRVSFFFSLKGIGNFGNVRGTRTRY